ncbi:hypothetical protein SCHPADRAFT_909041, partial [Schizopora paradoxa]
MSSHLLRRVVRTTAMLVATATRLLSIHQFLNFTALLDDGVKAYDSLKSTEHSRSVIM